MDWRRTILIVPILGFAALGCSPGGGELPADDQVSAGGKTLLADTKFDRQRAAMVNGQLRRRDITDAGVLRAMETVPRHEFVPENVRSASYEDGPLPIGNRQTISQPYIVALMTQLARPNADSRVLDVGTGSGYQAAVLAEIVDHVYSIEIVETLADQARARLSRLGYENIEVRFGDGYRGWPDQAPFDVIIVAAAPDHIPQPLIDQLASGGHLIIPVGKFSQNLTVVEKKADGSVETRIVAPVAFVPMTGQAQR
jgi:protein-L-isoaspartate(D-aspartate) O-methyltransferase